MNRERAKELLPIIQAYAGGKIIERKAKLNGFWNEVGESAFGDDYEYRIKPEPREFWINKDLVQVFDDKEDIVFEKESYIHVREVIE